MQTRHSSSRNESPLIISRLDMLLQKRSAASHQSPKVHNPKWSTEDQALIDWIYQHWNSDLFPITGKIVWAKIERLVNEGPDGAAARSRELQDGLIFIKKVIERL